MNDYNQYAAQGVYGLNEYSAQNQWAAQASTNYDAGAAQAQMAANSGWYEEYERNRARVRQELDWMRAAITR